MSFFFTGRSSCSRRWSQPLAVNMDRLSMLDFMSRGGAHLATDLRIIMPIRMPTDCKAVSDYDDQCDDLALGIAVIGATGNG